MSVREMKRCGNCKWTIEDWHIKRDHAFDIKIGNPFIVCPQCGSLIIKDYVKEANCLCSLDFALMFFWRIIDAIIYCFVPLFILCGIFDFKLWVLIISGIIYLIICIILILNKIKSNKIAIEASKERLKDSTYSKLIEKFFEDDIRESDINIL